MTNTDETTHLRALLAEQTTRAERAEAATDACLADFSRELDDARKQITESVMEWARKSGCVYCGEVFDTLGPEGAGDARRALYTAHTELCIKHPLRDVERDRDAALAACAELRAALESAHETLSERIRSYSLGDRPPSPPAWLLRLDDETLQALSRPDLGRGMVAVPRAVVERARKALGSHETCGVDFYMAAVADLDALLKKGGG